MGGERCDEMTDRREWPLVKESGPSKDSPNGVFLTADAYLRTARPLAGPLRYGTEPRVGPKGGRNGGETDFGMDRVAPRDFDPEGTVRNRFGEIPSRLISGQIRRR